MALYLFTIAAAILFISHVTLLLLSFKLGQLISRRYFYSHLTLWLTGICVFLLALTYSGTGQSAFLDYFNTFGKQLLILVFTAALSLVAHLIVTRLVLPLLTK